MNNEPWVLEPSPVTNAELWLILVAVSSTHNGLMDGGLLDSPMADWSNGGLKFGVLVALAVLMAYCRQSGVATALRNESLNQSGGDRTFNLSLFAHEAKKEGTIEDTTG